MPLDSLRKPLKGVSVNGNSLTESLGFIKGYPRRKHASQITFSNSGESPHASNFPKKAVYRKTFKVKALLGCCECEGRG